MAFLEVKGVSKKINDIVAVRDISFGQQALEKIAIAGETGSGKSTLLKIIAGLEQPDEGEVRLDGRRVKGPDEQLIPGHPGIAYLSQYFELRNNYRVGEILEMANQLPDERAAQLYEVCQISHLVGRKTNELSGGERQRIALARLLSGSPRLLLLDEPFTNLDAGHKQVIRSVIREISTALQATCIMVAHDAADIVSWADRVILMRNGHIVQQGLPEQVYRQPVDEYCAGLLGEYSLFDASRFFYGIEPAGGQLPPGKVLVRPERIVLSGEGKAHMQGNVEQVEFLGMAYRYSVRLGDRLVISVLPDRRYIPGDKVFLQIKPTEGWFIS
jgi:iron(III) transport system ATP-binding protein